MYILQKTAIIGWYKYNIFCYRYQGNIIGLEDLQKPMTKIVIGLDRISAYTVTTSLRRVFGDFCRNSVAIS